MGATIYVADEAGVRSDYHAGTTWAPVGRTPVVATTGDRFGINLIAAVTAKGTLRFAAYEGSLNGPVFIDFCRRLLHDSPGPVFLVLDGHPVHRSKAVRQLAASTGGRLRLCFLPGYAPELNPDEWVWKHGKHDRIGGAGVTSPEDLNAKALAALHRLQKLPHLVRSQGSGVLACCPFHPRMPSSRRGLRAAHDSTSRARATRAPLTNSATLHTSLRWDRPHRLGVGRSSAARRAGLSG